MKARLTRWQQHGFDFRLDWFIRCITTAYSGEAYFHALADITTVEFEQALLRTEKHIDTALHLISGRLGLDYDRVLGSRYSFPVFVRYLELRGGKLTDPAERDRLLYWYIHTFLWGRYAGSTESTLATDLNVLKSDRDPLGGLLRALRRDRDNLRLNANDFEGSNMSNRFYPLLYMLTRVWHAKDWQTGIDLTQHTLGKYSRLQVHHIFPKKRLRDAGYSQAQVNAVANFTFLTQDTNLVVSDRDPAEYLSAFAVTNPEAVASHWIPMDPSLWRVDRYLDFLDARRHLLADAANSFLNSLVEGTIPQEQVVPTALERFVSLTPGKIDGEDELNILEEVRYWVAQQGLSADSEIGFELIDPRSNAVVALLDLAWANDLQDRGVSPVALILDDDEALHIAQSFGYRCFSDPDSFKMYVRDEILQLDVAISP